MSVFQHVSYFFSFLSHVRLPSSFAAFQAVWRRHFSQNLFFILKLWALSSLFCQRDKSSLLLCLMRSLEFQCRSGVKSRSGSRWDPHVTVACCFGDPAVPVPSSADKSGGKIWKQKKKKTGGMRSEKGRDGDDRTQTRKTGEEEKERKIQLVSTSWSSSQILSKRYTVFFCFFSGVHVYSGAVRFCHASQWTALPVNAAVMHGWSAGWQAQDVSHYFKVTPAMLKKK